MVEEYDKVGGCKISIQILYLQTFIQKLRAMDLGFVSTKFTWENIHDGIGYITTD